MGEIGEIFPSSAAHPPPFSSSRHRHHPPISLLKFAAMQNAFGARSDDPHDSAYIGFNTSRDF
jgi:hypothetical protein